MREQAKASRGKRRLEDLLKTGSTCVVNITIVEVSNRRAMPLGVQAKHVNSVHVIKKKVRK